jgi:hypothetical protein
MEKEIILHRKNEPPWKFSYKREYQGYICKQRKYIYKLFVEDFSIAIKPIWIGLLTPDEKAWVTIEKEIKADYIEFIGCKIVFC